MLHESDHPAFVEVIEKASHVRVHNVGHLLLQERIRQRILRVMLAAPRAETIGESQKILLVNLVEDGESACHFNMRFCCEQVIQQMPNAFLLAFFASNGLWSLHRLANSSLMALTLSIFDFKVESSSQRGLRSAKRLG